MALEAGTRLGPYEIVSLLGKGGMGEVYRAKDTKLGREVAIKVLPEGFSDEPERMARFEREAKVLASLNHNNIATLHGFETDADTQFLVMEVVEGETLAERIKRGAIPVDEALPLFLQIAEGLEAAHEQGVIHRDLKPANIKVTDDGQVKILDFGLAKAMAPAVVSDSDPSESPTITAAGYSATRQGQILGTAAYMSPEQAKGKAVDKRADIWAFGVCLYEALTGVRPFRGEGATDTLAAVLRAEVDWDKLPQATPRSIRTLSRRCLQRDSATRLRDIGDAVLELAEDSREEEPDPHAERPGQPWWRQLLLVAAGAALAGLAFWGLAQREQASIPGERTVHRSVISASPSRPAFIQSNWTGDVAITPDGSVVVYLVREPHRSGPSDFNLYVRPVDQLQGELLAEGVWAVDPFVSPDGQWVGFHETLSEELRKVPIDGGPQVTICTDCGFLRGASWREDGTILFGTDAQTGLWRVSAAGGDPEVLTTPNREAGEDGHLWPDSLPDGDSVVFTVAKGSGVNEIALLSLKTGAWRTLLARGSTARYVSSGHLVYALKSDLWAVPFDLSKLVVTGDAAPVLRGVAIKTNTGYADYAVSTEGSLVFVSDSGATDLPLRFVRVDRGGLQVPLSLPARTYSGFRISPNGLQVVFAARDTEYDIRVVDLARESVTRLTSDPRVDASPIWYDSSRVVFRSDRDDEGDLYSVAANGTGEPQLILGLPGYQIPWDVSSDGKWLIYSTGTNPGDTSRNIGALDMAGALEPTELIASEFDDVQGVLSPNGRWMAYQSNESGQYEIYVTPFPDAAADRWIVSAGGGTEPVWSRDGAELFYRGAGEIFAVDTETEEGFRFGDPKTLFEDVYYRNPLGEYRTYDVAPDGEHFLFLLFDETDGAAAWDVILVQNWFEELKRLAPID